MDARDRLNKLIEATVGEAGRAAESPVKDDHLLEMEGRSFHFAVRPGRNEVVCSTVVYLTDRDVSQIHPEAIAEFNAYHLFRGGYLLSVDPLTLSLYISGSRSLEALERIGLPAFLTDLVSRCISCTRWYLAEHERLTEAPIAELAMAF